MPAGPWRHGPTREPSPRRARLGDMRSPVAFVFLVAALAGCGSTAPATNSGGDAPVTSSPKAEPTSTPGDSSPTGAEGSLTVTVDRGDGSAPTTWTLTCDPPSGTHPAPEKACAALAAVADPFAPVPRDAVCTEIYGGPQTATIRGTWRGSTVIARYQRNNGCEIARWDRLAAVFQTKGGV